MDIQQTIEQWPNNDPVELVDLLVDNGFEIVRGLVYNQDDDTVVKELAINHTNDITASVDKVNSVSPEFITSYTVNDQKDKIVLNLKKYSGVHPLDVKDNVDEMVQNILDKYFELSKLAQPAVIDDICNSNILIGDDNSVHIIDLDSVFYNTTVHIDLPDVVYQSAANWLQAHITKEEFIELWNQRF